MAKSKKSNKKNKKNNRNQTGDVQVSQDGVFSFGSEHTFSKYGAVVAHPGRLEVYDIVSVAGTRGEFKVVGKRMNGKKLIIECERLDGALGRRVQWIDGSIPAFTFAKNGDPIPLKATREVYGLEAIVKGRFSSPSEYGIKHRNTLIWVRQIDCVPA